MSSSNSGKAPALVAVEPHPIDIDVDSHAGHPPGSADASGTLEHAFINEPAVDDHDGDLITTAEVSHLKRGLAERHLSMLGIAGAIGTGLFLSLGGAIQTGGPLGALLGYAVVGGIVCAVQFALGEVTALLPVRPALSPVSMLKSIRDADLVALSPSRSRAALSAMQASWSTLLWNLQ